MTATGAAPAGDARLLRTTRRRLVLFSAASTLILLVVLGAVLYLAAQESLSGSAVAQLEARVAEARSFLLDEPPSDPEEYEHFGQFLFGGPQSGTALFLVDENGGLVQRPDAPVVSPDLPVMDSYRAAQSGGRDVRTATIHAGPDGVLTPVRVMSQAIQVRGDAYVIQALQDRTSEVRTLQVLLVVLALGGLAVVAAATLFGFVYAGRALIPIRESLRRQREFAADASHELRTPLSVVRGGVEHLRRHRDEPVRAMDDTLDDIEAEVGRLTGLVDDLLLLARSDSGVLELRTERLDLADVASEAVSSLRVNAAAADVQLVLDARNAPMDGDPDRLRQLVGILVDNAVRHSPRGGTVRVVIGADGRLVVEDEGPGMREEDLPHVFDRFWRADSAPAGGTGLGLAIAAWIVERHGGSIRATNRSDRSGGRFEVSLPA